MIAMMLAINNLLPINKEKGEEATRNFVMREEKSFA